MQGGKESSEVQLTNEPHPTPQLRDLQREILQYTRADGVGLNAELFLPPGYDKDKHGPLPCLLWAYPRCAPPRRCLCSQPQLNAACIRRRRITVSQPSVSLASYRPQLTIPVPCEQIRRLPTPVAAAAWLLCALPCM